MLLYDYPLAYNPAKPRLMLIERQKQQLQTVPVELKFINLFNGQSLDPHFLNINPKGTVPVLVDGGTTIAESLEIVRYLDKDQPLGGDAVDRKFVDEWGKQVDAWDGNLFLTANTAESAKGILQLISNFRIKYAEARAKQNPGLKDVYEAKIAAMKAADKEPNNAAAIKANDNKLVDLLDAAETRLAGGTTWLAGTAYSEADVMLTVLLFRITMAKLQSKYIEPRPKVNGYYGRVQQRPSWKAAFGTALSGAGSAKLLLPAVGKALISKVTGLY